MELFAIQRQVKASELPLEQLASNTQIPEADKVAEVSRQFEAVLLRHILADVQKPLFASTMNPESFASGVYRDTITSALADTISRSGTFGLAKTLQAPLAKEFHDKTRVHSDAGTNPESISKVTDARSL